LHNPQGRVVALLALARTREMEVLAALPAEMTEPVINRLRKFVLRAKVTIENASAEVQVTGLPRALDELEPDEAVVRWGDRWLALSPAGRHSLDTRMTRDQWELDDLRQGLPQVFAATTEQFVAQMLNLDLLGAIAFDKGCYTGQEVIARAHYRGRVKRRMQRWLNPHGPALQPGNAAHAADGRSLTVVRVATSEAGQEVLAVGNFAAVPEQQAEAGAVREGPELAGPLPLPYALPE
jgi:folate-binding protein YgfZ